MNLCSCENYATIFAKWNSLTNNAVGKKFHLNVLVQPKERQKKIDRIKIKTKHRIKRPIQNRTTVKGIINSQIGKSYGLLFFFSEIFSSSEFVKLWQSDFVNFLITRQLVVNWMCSPPISFRETPARQEIPDRSNAQRGASILMREAGQTAGGCPSDQPEFSYYRVLGSCAWAPYVPSGSKAVRVALSLFVN